VIQNIITLAFKETLQYQIKQTVRLYGAH